jgi:hypothetical protein
MRTFSGSKDLLWILLLLAGILLYDLKRLKKKKKKSAGTSDGR